MDNLIVGTDFSISSESALNFAITLANSSHSEITVLWVDNSDVELSNMEYQAIRKDGQETLDKIVSKYAKKLKTGKKINTKIRKGKIYQELNEYAESTPNSFLIIGTHGLTGFKEFWIGNNAFRVISTAKCPVITVKASHDTDRKIKRIVLPIDHSSSTLLKMEIAAKLASTIKADICLLGINESQLKSIQKVVDANLNKAAIILDKYNVPYIINQINTDDIGKAIIEHSTALDADLLLVTVELQEKTLNGMPSMLMQKLINYSPIPLMSIYPFK